MGTVEVIGSGGKQVQLLAQEHFVYPLAEEERPQVICGGQDFVYAPVAEGASAGWGYVMIAGKAVGRIPLVYGQTVEQENLRRQGLLEKLFGGS